MNRTWVKRRDAAAIFGCSLGVFDRRVRPRISSYMIGRSVRFKHKDVVGLFEACKAVGVDPITGMVPSGHG